MAKYIDSEKLIAEIKRLKGELMYGSCNALIQVETNCKNEAYNEILSCIDSLQQEQQVLPGMKERGIPGKDFIPVEWVDACEQYGRWKIIQQEQPEVDLEKDEMIEATLSLFYEEKGFIGGFNAALEIAKYFYNLGLNARKEESK